MQEAEESGQARTLKQGQGLDWRAGTSLLGPVTGELPSGAAASLSSPEACLEVSFLSDTSPV